MRNKVSSRRPAVLLLLMCSLWDRSGAAKEAVVRGAYPGAWYSESFKCLDRSAKGKLGTRAVNDGYCDCADGSDEPGTPACPMGRFFCKNADHRGSFISSSLVDDGICDCCDGSDEEGTSVSCQDTCAAEAAKEKELALVTQKHEEIGERARAQMAAAAQEIKKQLESQAEENQGKLKEMQGRMQAMHAALSDRNGDRRKMAQVQQQYQALRQQMQRVGNHHSRAVHLLRLNAKDLLALVQDCSTSSVLSDNVIKGGTVTFVPKHYTFSLCPFEYVIQFWEKREDWEYQTCIAEHGAVNLTDGSSNQKYCEDKTKSTLQVVDPVEAARHAKYCKAQPTQEHVKACTAQMEGHFQEQHLSKLRTFLGLYEPTKSVIHKHWVFVDSGEPCQNGQHRQVNVTLVCGASGSNGSVPWIMDPAKQGKRSSGKILSVSENGMCNYEMVLETPAACKEGAAVPSNGGWMDSWFKWDKDEV